MKRVCFVGLFDLFIKGYEDVVVCGFGFFDEIIVVVG